MTQPTKVSIEMGYPDYDVLDQSTPSLIETHWFSTREAAEAAIEQFNKHLRTNFNDETRLRFNVWIDDITPPETFDDEQQVLANKVDAMLEEERDEQFDDPELYDEIDRYESQTQ